MSESREEYSQALIKNVIIVNVLIIYFHLNHAVHISKSPMRKHWAQWKLNTVFQFQVNDVVDHKINFRYCGFGFAPSDVPFKN